MRDSGPLAQARLFQPDGDWRPARTRFVGVTEQELRDALEAFADDTFASVDPDAQMGLIEVDVRKSIEYSVTTDKKQGYNATATAFVGRLVPEGMLLDGAATSRKVARKRRFYEILRDALEADPTLGGRWPVRVRVMPGDAVSVATRLDDAS